MKYLTINLEAKEKFGLSFSDYCYLDAVSKLSGNAKYAKMVASFNTIAGFYGFSRRQIIRSKNNLLKKGLIKKEKDGFSLTEKYFDNFVLSSDKMSPASDKMSLHTSDKMSPNKENINKEIYINNNNNIVSDSVAEHESKNIVSIFDAFREFNPAISRMYGNKTQREACKDLIKTYGLETVLKAIRVLPQINSEKYSKKSFTPLQLWNNWASYAFKAKEKKNPSGIGVVI